MEKNDKEEKEPIDIEQKTYPYNDKNAIDFKWSGWKEEDEEEIALSHFIESFQSKLMRKFIQKVTGWLWYCT